MTKRQAMTKSSTWRGKGWTFSTYPELRTILEMAEVLSLSSNDWNELQLSYRRVAPPDFAPKDTDANKRKFFALRNTRKPTGDHICPPEVTRSKRAFRSIAACGGVIQLDNGEEEQNVVDAAEQPTPTTTQTGSHHFDCAPAARSRCTAISQQRN